MLPFYFVAFLAFKCVAGAKIPSPPPGASTPVFRDECKDPSLNDCPPTSVCVDQFYGFVCQCKPGFVDKSPNIQDNPGRVCVQDGAAGTNGTIAPEAIPEEPPTPPSVSGTPRDTSPKLTERTEPPKDEFTKSPLDQIARDAAATEKPKGHKKKGHAKNVTTQAPEADKEKEQEPAPATEGSTDAATKDAFDYFDTSKDGQINLAELKAATRNLGQKLSNDDIKRMLAAADKNGDGVVNFEEFNRFMKASRRRTSSASS